VQLARSRWQYHPHRPDDGPLAAALAVKAAALSSNIRYSLPDNI
jgi:hypothetical protein